MVLTELIDNDVVDLTKSHVGKEASVSEKIQMIKILEHVGKVLQPLELSHIINNLPKELLSDKEKLTRFLLLTAFLDQQAESPSARKTIVRTYNVFGDNSF
ncbi:MAG: hypothetical protein QHH18_07005 [Candidatus Bathyarchaeota archaeon]|jgi:ferritin|nr:hypothetical protein [Candidatus Bathyarchaeota archaeon]